MLCNGTMVMATVDSCGVMPIFRRLPDAQFVELRLAKSELARRAAGKTMRSGNAARRVVLFLLLSASRLRYPRTVNNS